MGRPKKEDKEKFTIYLNTEIAQNIKDLAHFNRTNVSDLIEEIAKKYAAENELALKVFHKAIEEIKGKKPDSEMPAKTEQPNQDQAKTKQPN